MYRGVRLAINGRPILESIPSAWKLIQNPRYLVAESSSQAAQAPISNSSKSKQIAPGIAKDGLGAKSSSCSPKIDEIVQAISQLSLLEAAELVDALKSRLNIKEVAMPVQAAVRSDQPTAHENSGHKQEQAEPPKPKEKTTFNLTLTQIDATKKAKVIKEVKTIMPSMNLVEAKKFVESLPKLLKENGTKEEIEKLKEVLEGVGATVQVE